MLLSARAYAKYRCVSHTAVQKAIKAGYLRKALVKKNKKKLINVSIADAEWEPFRAPKHQKHSICPVCGGLKLQ